MNNKKTRRGAPTKPDSEKHSERLGEIRVMAAQLERYLKGHTWKAAEYSIETFPRDLPKLSPLKPSGGGPSASPSREQVPAFPVALHFPHPPPSAPQARYRYPVTISVLAPRALPVPLKLVC